MLGELGRVGGREWCLDRSNILHIGMKFSKYKLHINNFYMPVLLWYCSQWPKLPKCLLISKWIKICYTHTVEHYSAIN